MSDHIGHPGVNCHEAQEIIDDYRRRAAESQQTFEMQVERIQELEEDEQRRHDGYYYAVVQQRKNKQLIAEMDVEIDHLKKVIMLLADAGVESERTRILIQRIADEATMKNAATPDA